MSKFDDLTCDLIEHITAFALDKIDRSTLLVLLDVTMSSLHNEAQDHKLMTNHHSLMTNN